MKPVIALLFIAIAFAGCNQKTSSNKEVSTDLINNPATANNPANNKDLPIIKFTNELYDFGIIIQGEVVDHSFKFKNIGKTDLIIKNASASCGCTVPSFPTKPIAPGEEGEIVVKFNSANRTGRQHKTITVWSNTQPNMTKLSIECEIVKSKK